MKVLWIIPGDGEGSSFIFSRRQIRKLQEMGVEGEVYFLKSRTNPFALFRARKEVKQIMKQLKPDIIHAHYGSINGLFATCIKHPKTVITFHGSDLNNTVSESFIRNKITKLASRYSLKRSVANIIQSQALKDIIPSKYHYKSHVVPLGVDEDVFMPIHREEARETLGWNQQEFVVLFNGNNPKIKRLDIALAAIELIRKQFPTIRLEVLSGAIDPEKIPLMLNASNVVLLCSDSEGSPTIIKEAMACNVPIVSNIVGDTEKRLTNVNGAVLTTQNPMDIANNIMSFLPNTNNNAYNLRESFFSQHLSGTHSCQETLQIYETILKIK